MSGSRLFIIAALLAGCAATRPEASTPRGAAVLSMQLDVLPQEGQTLENLHVQGTLPRGARYAVKAQVGAPVYLYLVQFVGPAGGKVVYPRSGQAAQPAAPGTSVHIPDDGTWFAQGPKPGTEVLVLLAAPGPLDGTRVLAEAQRPSSPAPGKGRGPVPQPVGEDKRGEIIEVAQDLTGVTVARFPFTRAGEGL